MAGFTSHRTATSHAGWLRQDGKMLLGNVARRRSPRHVDDSSWPSVGICWLILPTRATSRPERETSSGCAPLWSPLQLRRGDGVAYSRGSRAAAGGTGLPAAVGLPLRQGCLQEGNGRSRSFQVLAGVPGRAEVLRPDGALIAGGSEPAQNIREIEVSGTEEDLLGRRPAAPARRAFASSTLSPRTYLRGPERHRP